VIRVLLADDHQVLREGLRRCLEGAGLEVVGEVGDGMAAVRAVEELAPDVVLMDVSLPGLDGIEATRQVRARRPEAAVVMLTMYADPTTLHEAVRAGATGYLGKDCTTAELIQVIRTVAGGESALGAGLAGSLLASRANDRETVLSHREVEVLQLVALGASTAEVARRLFISAKTVKNHLSSIYEKVDARDRTQAVIAGLRLGLVRAPGPKVHHPQ
jgi:two-component system, NarL family, response regulator DegU